MCLVLLLSLNCTADTNNVVIPVISAVGAQSSKMLVGRVRNINFARGIHSISSLKSSRPYWLIFASVYHFGYGREMQILLAGKTLNWFSGDGIHLDYRRLTQH